MNLAFVVGCARSGTSILGELIAAHPHVSYVFEAHQVWEWGGEGADGSHRLTGSHATPELRARIADWLHEWSAGRPLLVEKNPRNVLRIPYLRALFPEAKIVHIVRDGRDAACSMVPGCGGDDWQHLKPPPWRELERKYKGVMRCALAWREILEIALADLASVPHLQVRYEDLVREPRTAAARLLDHLGLPAHPDVHAFCDRVRDETAGSYHAQVQTRWYRDDHRRRVGRWRENLRSDEQSAVEEALRPLLTRLGYA